MSMPRQKTRHSRARVDDVNAGFSLLELTVVVVVLGILSSVSLPRISSFLDFADIDQAKSLLNSAAADCLQKYRTDEKNKDEIDDTILSDENLKPIGYKIDKSNDLDTCTHLELRPTDEDDSIRFPIGFTLDEGNLTKIGEPTSSDEGSINSCKSWAGTRCDENEDLKELIAWKKGIEQAKQACDNRFEEWEKNGFNPYVKTDVGWVASADKSCPKRPPKDGSTSYKNDPECTPNGCNRDGYSLDNKFVGWSKDAYDIKLKEKYGAECTDWVENKKRTNYTNDPQNKPQTKEPECGSQEFWFYKGVDVITKPEFDNRICSDNVESEKSKTSGKSLKKAVPGCGSQIYYFCDNKIKDSEKEYKECSCEVEKYNKAQEGEDGAFSTTESGAEGCGDFWICDKEISTQETYDQNCKDTCIPNALLCSIYGGDYCCR